MEVRYIDHMGSDLRVVNAARVSFHKHHEALEENDERLIRYLARHNHWTPFGHCFVTLIERVPLAIARQRRTHRIGFHYNSDDFTFNELSRRYVDEEPEFYAPEIFRSRPVNGMKQGSGEELEESILDQVEVLYREHLYYSKDFYNRLIKLGLAPEQARLILPECTYTEYYVTGSLAAWARAYQLRNDKNAQKEIQELAIKWGEIIEPLFPISWRYLTDG